MIRSSSGGGGGVGTASNAVAESGPLIAADRVGVVVDCKLYYMGGMSHKWGVDGARFNGVVVGGERGSIVEKESRAVGVGGSDKKKKTAKEIKWVELGDRQFDYRVIAVE